MVDFADRRKAAIEAFTKEEIRKATSKVIAEHGLQGLTMSLVAEAAGVAKGTLYNYFPDKAALVTYVIFKSAEPLADRVEGIAAGELPPDKQLSSMARCVLDTVFEHQELITLAMQARMLHPPPEGPEGEMRQMRERLIRAATAVIERGMAQGVFRKSDAAMTAHVFMTSVGGVIGPRLMKEVDHPLEEETDCLLSVLLHGIMSADAKSGRKK